MNISDLKDNIKALNDISDISSPERGNDYSPKTYSTIEKKKENILNKISEILKEDTILYENIKD